MSKSSRVFEAGGVLVGAAKWEIIQFIIKEARAAVAAHEAAGSEEKK